MNTTNGYPEEMASGYFFCQEFLYDPGSFVTDKNLPVSGFYPFFVPCC